MPARLGILQRRWRQFKAFCVKTEFRKIILSAVASTILGWFLGLATSPLFLNLLKDPGCPDCMPAGPLGEHLKTFVVDGREGLHQIENSPLVVEFAFSEGPAVVELGGRLSYDRSRSVETFRFLRVFSEEIKGGKREIIMEVKEESIQAGRAVRNYAESNCRIRMDWFIPAKAGEQPIPPPATLQIADRQIVITLLKRKLQEAGEDCKLAFD